MRLILFTLLFAFSGLQTTPASAGLLEFFFPSLAKKEPDLTETLRAPFAEPPAAGNEEQTEALSKNSVPIELPHMQNGQMAKQISTMVSESLAFQSTDYKDDLRKILGNFDEEGKAEYKKFLQDSKIARVLQTNKFYIRSIVTDTPILINSGPVQNRHRWLFDVPVMVSYMKRDTADYKAGNQATNQKMTVRIQVGRSEDAPAETGVFTERWSAKVKSVDRP